MSNDNVKSATFVYVGRRANGYGSPTSVSHVIHQIAGKSAMAVGEECRFDKAPKNWLPGQIYEVEFDGDGYRLSAATFVGVWEDESQIAAWRTRDLADDIAGLDFSWRVRHWSHSSSLCSPPPRSWRHCSHERTVNSNRGNRRSDPSELQSLPELRRVMSAVGKGLA